MPRDQQTIFPVSGMDSDSDLSKVKEGDYLSPALNIRQITDGGQTTHSIEPVKGNLRSYTIPPVVAQNKKYRFTNILIGTNSISTAWVLTIKIDGITITSAQINAGITAIANLGVLALFFRNSISHTKITNVITSTGTNNVDLELEIEGTIGGEYTLEVSSNNIAEIALIAEATPIGLAGEMTQINSFDLNSNLFVWSTRSSTETKIKLDLSFFIFTSSSGISITTIYPHNLWNGQTIEIEGATIRPILNGTWTISNVTTTYPYTFLLVDSPQGLGGSQGNPDTITLYYYVPFVANLSEIGVATHDINTDIWTYTRLIRTKKWNFNALKKPDIHMEQNNIEWWFGWVDDFNLPRVFYYSGDFITDGAIEGINDAGKYTYELIEEETRLFLANSKVKFEFTGQTQSGGAVHSGNWRYSIRLLTENKTPTDWLDLSNPVNVFIAIASSSNPEDIFGDKHIPTPKINNFTISNIPPGLFNFLELAGVEYSEDAIAGQTILRESIDPDQTSIDLQHTGNETATPLVLGLLNEKNVTISTAKNMIAIDNRLLLSNLTNRQVYDFTEWAKTFKYTLRQKELTSVGDIGENFGEYQDPDNVHNNVGYMYNETYRFSVKGRLKTGGYTQNFWTNDIKFNTDQTTPDGRRLGSFDNYDLTNSGFIPTKIKVPYVEFNRPDFDFIIDGLKVSDIIDQIIIERVDVTPKYQEVLATGVIIKAVENSSTLNFEFLPSGKIGNYPFVEIDSSISSYFPPDVTPFQSMGTFYSPDILYNNVSISFQPNDKLLNKPTLGQATETTLITRLTGFYKQFGGQFTDLTELPINDAKILQRGTNITVGGKDYSSKLKKLSVDVDGNIHTTEWEMEKGLVIQTSGDIGITGNGLSYCQYFREKTNKYGDKTKTQYIPTGTTYDVSSSGVIKVFGGDTFTQKTYFKYKYRTGDVDPPEGVFVTAGGGGGLIFYSQNRVNTQMRSEDSIHSDNDFPKTDAATWLLQKSSPAFTYNRGYNIKNGINSNRAFDPSLKIQQNMPVRIIYSATKPQNSLVDNYREFQAFNFKDLDLSFGEIVHMANGNNELIAWQKRAFKLLNFNTRNVLVTSDGLELMIGTGAVMAGDDRILSAYGCNNKWSIIEAKSEQGNKMFAWINTEFKKVIRYSYDGTRSLEYIKKMRSFFNNYLDWVKGKDEPVGGEGIHGIWDDEFGELIWTVNGKRVVSEITPVDPPPETPSEQDVEVIDR